jgi:hypothetical protein
MFSFHFREEYDNVAFAFVSDDMEWGRKNIKNKKKDLVNSIDRLFKSLWVNSIDFFHYFFSMAEIAHL